LQVQELKILANQRAARIRASAPPPMLSSQVHVCASLSYARRAARAVQPPGDCCLCCNTVQHVSTCSPTRETRARQCASCAAAAQPRPFVHPPLPQPRCPPALVEGGRPVALGAAVPTLYGLHAHACTMRPGMMPRVGAVPCRAVPCSAVQCGAGNLRIHQRTCAAQRPRTHSLVRACVRWA
jgi:hypothetical protein